MSNIIQRTRHAATYAQDIIGSATMLVFWSDEDDGWVAITKDHPGLSWVDKTPSAAIAGLERVIAEVEEMTP
jgi:predicted RNase H-like HicB family nuclease